jgi:hypothetical protein
MPWLAVKWYVLSTKHSGRETIDILDVAGATDDITVTITDTPSELTGTLVDSSGRPATDYFIVVFSTNRKYWTDQSRRIREVRPATDGSYVCRNLPKGDYFVAVLADLAPGEAFDSTFLDSLVTAAQVVTIADGIKTSQSFRIGG